MTLPSGEWLNLAGSRLSQTCALCDLTFSSMSSNFLIHFGLYFALKSPSCSINQIIHSLKFYLFNSAWVGLPFSPVPSLEKERGLSSLSLSCQKEKQNSHVSYQREKLSELTILRQKSWHLRSFKTYSPHRILVKFHRCTCLNFFLYTVSELFLLQSLETLWLTIKFHLYLTACQWNREKKASHDSLKKDHTFFLTIIFVVS